MVHSQHLIAPQPVNKTKQSSKLKAKPAAKPKTKPAPVGNGRLTPTGGGPVIKGKKSPAISGATTSVTKKAVPGVLGASRSRSTSEMPGSSAPETIGKVSKEQEERMNDEEVDDKLYCICKTSYDEDRVMIACDRRGIAQLRAIIPTHVCGGTRCDEWYHTSCLNMPDLEVDLVDQFYCPTCVAGKYPFLLSLCMVLIHCR